MGVGGRFAAKIRVRPCSKVRPLVDGLQDLGEGGISVGVRGVASRFAGKVGRISSVASVTGQLETSLPRFPEFQVDTPADRRIDLRNVRKWPETTTYMQRALDDMPASDLLSSFG